MLFYNEANRLHAFPSRGEILATNPCLPGWAPVLTPNGFTFFKNVNKSILIHNKPEVCSNLIKTHDNARVYEVKLDCGLTAYMTLNHKIAVTSKLDKPLEELHPGDTILLELNNILDNNSFDESKFEIGIADWKNRKTNNCIAKGLNQNFSYHFGLILGSILTRNLYFDKKDQLVVKDFDNDLGLQILQLYLFEFGIYSEFKYHKLFIKTPTQLTNILTSIKRFDLIKKLNLNDLADEKINLKQKITSIEYYSTEPVYDIQVPTTNHFITSGMVVHNCGEVTLPDYSMCNLGSLNLIQFLNDDNNFDWDKFKKYIRLGVTFLDNVIDKTSYPTEDFSKRMLSERPIGLGLMGLSWLFFKMGITYGSDESIQLFEKICKTLTVEAFRESINRAEKFGQIVIPEKDYNHFTRRLQYFGLNDNDIELFHKHGIRNSTVTSIAPTGTVAISADTSYAFEPEMALIWSKKLVDSDRVLYFTNKIFEEACNKAGVELTDKIKDKISQNKGSCQGIDEIPLEIQKVFVTAFDVGWKKKIKMQEAGQRWITLAISSTCNLPYEATVKDVEDAYVLAWKSKLKGITVYRDGSIFDQPVNFGGSDKKEPEKTVPEVKVHINDDCYKKIKRPMIRLGKTIELKTPHGTLYVTGNINETGDLIEVFLNLGQQGHVTNILLNALGRVISKYLQFGLPLKEICDTLSNCGGLGFFATITNDGKSQQVDSIVDAISKVLETHFGQIDQSDLTSVDKLINVKAIEPLGDKCPQCGEMTLTHASGCRGGSCPNCGYSTCQ